MNKKEKERFINIILLVIAAILIVLNLIIILKMNNKDENKNEVANNETTTTEKEEIEDEEEVVEKDVKTMSEQKRMKYYLNKFLDSIEEKDYKTAYGYLNQDFKNNYFGSEEEFKNYVQNKWNISTMVIKYTNIQRIGNPINGNIYILFVNLVNVLEKQDNEEGLFETKFVILEKDYDDFELSFSLEE